MNSVSLNTKCPNFKGNVVLVNKKGYKTLLPAKQIRAIEECSGFSSDYVRITSIIDPAYSRTFQVLNIPYQEVVDLYKTAMNTDQDVEINID